MAMAARRTTHAGDTTSAALDFTLPDELVAREPPEARGLARDDVRLLVTDATGNVRHAVMRDLPGFLRPGDLLVVNSSATINAALDGWRPGTIAEPDEMITVHLSSPIRDAREASEWAIELRRSTLHGKKPLLDARSGERIRLRGGATARLVAPFGRLGQPGSTPNGGVRLWKAELECPAGVLAYAAEHGTPIRYGYVTRRWPLHYYQTVFADEPGSAEMPSAGRPFTHDLVARLESSGVEVASVVLHTGVASLEAGEAPYPERYRVPVAAANAINDARDRGGRVIAVGTTVVRALATVAALDGTVRPDAGWTELVIAPDDGVRVIDGLLTGFHEPHASHFAMLQAVAGLEQLVVAYDAALRGRYLWHEFGDVHLLLASP